MRLGDHLFRARKQRGLSQENVAEKLGVSRQTISKWELDETLPDIRQAKKLSTLYQLSLDDLIDFDLNVQEVQDVIERTNEKISDKVNWTKAWGKKYPILLSYQQQVDTNFYAEKLSFLIDDLEEKYNYSEMDAFLVLKDVLAAVWKNRKASSK